MAGSINKVILVGNLGRDPEIRSMSSGDKVCNLSIATSERWKDKNTGDQQERTEWHRIVIFDQQLIDVCERFLNKGRKVYIEGQLQTRKWTDQNGQEKYSTEVVLQRFRGQLVILDSRAEGGGGGGGGGGYERSGGDQDYGGASGGGASGGSSGGGGRAPVAELDDEIPF